jgi:hypothetical protein
VILRGGLAWEVETPLPSTAPSVIRYVLTARRVGAAQEEFTAAAVLEAQETLAVALSQWEEVVSKLATKETIMCTLDARIASLKADVMAQVDTDPIEIPVEC